MTPANSMQISYDEESDIIYAIRTFADREKTKNIDMRPGIVVRIDVRTDQAVGFIIHGFSRLFPNLKELGEYALMESFDFSLDAVNNSRKNLQSQEPA